MEEMAEGKRRTAQDRSKEWLKGEKDSRCRSKGNTKTREAKDENGRRDGSRREEISAPLA
ncbi:MAG: hypothetical protein PUD05_07430 [Lachnospiraceae bacterium]|nr:hypothetical protein [Lachnospiraceae bacterium]